MSAPARTKTPSRKAATKAPARTTTKSPSRPGGQNAKATIAAALAQIDAARGSTRPAGATRSLAKLKQTITPHPDHEAVLAIHDGGLHLDSYDLLAAKNVPLWLPEARRFGASLVPFAADSGGNLWCIDARGAVLGVELQGPQGTFRRAKSVQTLLEDIVARLAKGTLVVDAQGHIVEPIPEPAVEAANEDDEDERRIEYPFADEVEKLIKTGNAKKLTALLDRKRLRVDGRFWSGPSLLAEAASERQTTIVELLLDRGCPVDDGKREGLRTALFAACWGLAPCADLVRLLLARGADPNALTAYDGTPLHSAVMWEHADALALLVKAGGDPSAKTQTGESVLAAAKKAPAAKRKALLAALEG